MKQFETYYQAYCEARKKSVNTSDLLNSAVASGTSASELLTYTEACNEASHAYGAVFTSVIAYFPEALDKHGLKYDAIIKEELDTFLKPIGHTHLQKSFSKNFIQAFYSDDISRIIFLCAVMRERTSDMDCTKALVDIGRMILGELPSLVSIILEAMTRFPISDDEIHSIALSFIDEVLEVMNANDYYFHGEIGAYIEYYLLLAYTKPAHDVVVKWQVHRSEHLTDNFKFIRKRYAEHGFS